MSDTTQENAYDVGPLSLRLHPFWQLLGDGHTGSEALVEERSPKVHRSDGGEPPLLASGRHAPMAPLGEPFPLKDAPGNTPAEAPPPSSAQPPPKTPRFT